MEKDLVTRLSELERRHRRLRALLLINATVLLAVLASFAASCASTQARSRTSAPSTLRVSEIVVVDPQGIERVRIGGDLPDAIIRGRRVPRGQKAAGVLVYDDTGQERGGYLTFSPSGHVALTLDSREGQVATFVADPQSGAVLKMSHQRGALDLHADEDGARFTATREKQVVFQEPPLQEPEKSAACAELKGARSRFSEAQVMGFCREVMLEDACHKCLAAQ